MAGKIHVRVRLFSHLKHVLGWSEMALDLAEGATASDAAARLRDLAGGCLDGVVFRLAVNQEYVSDSRALVDGDEVALIPPVQGG